MCDYAIEKRLIKQNYKYICGIDEVGRGAIFGPVVAGAVILDPHREQEYLKKGIKDSKKLSPRRRLELAEYIYLNAIAFSLGWCWNDEIDEINILKGTQKAMEMAIKRLQIFPDYVLIDGMEPFFSNIDGQGVVKGDNKSISIAAASIIAKIFRDELMISFGDFFPAYQFKNNKGYPTKEHIIGVSKMGFTEFHRKSFKIRGKDKWQKKESHF